MTVARARVWLLGVLGAGSLGYVLVMRSLVPTDLGAEGLVWPLLGVVPLFGFGLWLASVSDSRQGLYLLLGGTGMAVSAAHETVLETHPELLSSSAFPWFNGIGLTADVLSTVGGVLAIAAFPDGRVERVWQRRALHLVWLTLLVFPATLLTSPEVPVSPWLRLDAPVPNPYAVEGLAWLAPGVTTLLLLPWASLVLALVVFTSRALFGDEPTRQRMRVMGLTVAGTALVMGLWAVGDAAGLPQQAPVMTGLQVLVYAAMLALPVALIHGVVQYGAFGVAGPERATVAIRSSWLLLAVLYGCAVAAPALLLADTLTPTSAVVVTVLTALVLQPVRARAEEYVRRRVLGDRDRQLALLTTLGSQLEQRADLGEVLTDLAEAITDGLAASWATIRVVDPEGGWSAVPEGGVAGIIEGPPAVTRDLVRTGERVGRIDVGPRKTGVYSSQELELLTTVARQASTAVANLRLTARLAEQLDELAQSRARLVAAQDEERRRIERDLHDGIQQNVVALIAGLRLARNRLARGELGEDDLAGLQDQAKETLADLREIAHGIHPPVLSDSGLVAAVESGASRFPLPLSVQADEVVCSKRFAPEVEAAAYYVVREALTNSVKHAAATSARVRLSADEHRLRVEVADDGCGFDTAVRRAEGGLANLRDRVAAVRGRLSVTSGALTGTVVAAEMPTGHGGVGRG